MARLANRPLERFLRVEAASGIVLLFAAAVALGWANSPWAASYTRFWGAAVGVRLGGFAVERTLAWCVNDGLMVLFFFLSGMELRRELHHGELSTWRRAALPVVAALGGMLAPALLYLFLAGAAPTRSGWGVPVATDIAFAVGILSLLGRRVPAALRVLLLALAVIDDLGAIVVIAVFYSSGLAPAGLALAALSLGGVLVLQRLGVRARGAYVVPTVAAWVGFQGAGIHPAITGVFVGVLTPVRAWLGPEGFLVGVRRELDRIAQAAPEVPSSREFAQTLREVDVARREALSPAEGLIHALHPWVAFGIMPLFALANAGVTVSAVPSGGASGRVALAVALGLVLGKPLGVLLASGLTLRFGVTALPAGITGRHLAVLGVVAGVGFTMALFIAQLAFTDTRLLAAARLGVVGGSVVAAALGPLVGRALLPSGTPTGAAQTADEAESSTER
jgi:NhaA family Na+:H+ antiporter